MSRSLPRRPTGRSSSRIVPSGNWSCGARASIQSRLPPMVLISPLWARKRNGWAIAQVGRVLVE